MSHWSEVLAELQRDGPNDRPNSKATWAKILERKIRAFSDYTARPCLLYASACTSPAKILPPGALQIDFSDKVGFHEITHSLKSVPVDLVIHSPGGSPEATESIVESLHSKLPNIRVIVPSFAKSAATMIAMSAHEILMDEDSELGPIDPQMQTANGFSPAEAVKDQFLKAQAEISADPKKLPSWLPILQQMGPSLLVQCDNAIELSKTLVGKWLSRFMLAGDPDADRKATEIARYLAQHSNFKSHGRCIRLKQLQDLNLGLKISTPARDPELQNRIMQLYAAVDVIFSATGIYKLFFNSRGDAMVRAIAPQQFNFPPMLAKQEGPTSPR